MASLLSTTQIAGMTGTMKDHFDTFSRSIVVHKESKKTINAGAEADINLDFVYGYGEEQTELQNNYEYTPVNASFSALIRYGKNQGEDVLPDVSIRFPEGVVVIKVELDCYNYIKDGGKTEKITFDDKHWKIIGAPRAKFYLSRPMYLFQIQEIV
jgi:hypothetical protein